MAHATAYSVRQAAALLGCSVDALERHHGELHGYRVGRRILFPRWAIDRLVCDPDASDAPSQDGSTFASVAGSPVERVVALLSLLSESERVRVATVALSPVAATDAGGGR
jgi:excisionase family DNA binding protein